VVRAPRATLYFQSERSDYARGTARAADTHVFVTITWTCPIDPRDLRCSVALFQDVDPAARHIAIIVTDTGELELAFDRGVPEITLSGDGSSTLSAMGRMV